MILGVDSSSPVGSAALVDAGRMVREEAFAGGRSRGGGVARAIADLVGGGEVVETVVVGIGPGSYSGVRAAVAAAWGFAAARGTSLFGVSSLLALGPGEYLAVGDARRDQFYCARVRDAAFVEEPHLLDRRGIEEAAARCPDFPIFVPQELPFPLPGQVVANPRAALLAGLAPVETEPGSGLPEMPSPLYLKPPSITPPSTRRK